MLVFGWISLWKNMYEGPGLRTIPSREEVCSLLPQTRHLNKLKSLWLHLPSSRFPDHPGNIKQKPRIREEWGKPWAHIQGSTLLPYLSLWWPKQTYFHVFPYLASRFFHPALSQRVYLCGEAKFYENSPDFPYFTSPRPNVLIPI